MLALARASCCYGTAQLLKQQELQPAWNAVILLRSPANAKQRGLSSSVLRCTLIWRQIFFQQHHQIESILKTLKASENTVLGKPALGVCQWQKPPLQFSLGRARPVRQCYTTCICRCKLSTGNSKIQWKGGGGEGANKRHSFPDSLLIINKTNGIFRLGALFPAYLFVSEVSRHTCEPEMFNHIDIFRVIIHPIPRKGWLQTNSVFVSDTWLKLFGK